VKKFNGREALLRVRNRKSNKDAEHRVPTGSGPYAQRRCRIDGQVSDLDHKGISFRF
jgi:hypothetical protein